MKSKSISNFTKSLSFNDEIDNDIITKNEMDKINASI